MTPRDWLFLIAGAALAWQAVVAAASWIGRELAIAIINGPFGELKKKDR